MVDNPKNNDPNEWDDEQNQSEEFDDGSLSPPTEESMFISDEDMEEDDSSQSIMPGEDLGSGTSEGDSDVLIEDMEESSESVLPEDSSVFNEDVVAEEEDSSVSMMPSDDEDMMLGEEEAFIEEEDSSQSMMPGDAVAGSTAGDSDVLIEEMDDSSESMLPDDSSVFNEEVVAEEEDSSVSVMPAGADTTAEIDLDGDSSQSMMPGDADMKENMEDSSESVFPEEEPEEPGYSMDPGSLFIAESEVGDEGFAYPGAAPALDSNSGGESDSISPGPEEDEELSETIDPMDDDRSSSLQVPAMLGDEGPSDDLSYDTIAAIAREDEDMTVGPETVDTPDPMLSDDKKAPAEANAETIQDPAVEGRTDDEEEDYAATVVADDPNQFEGDDHFHEDERYRATFQARTADGDVENEVVEAFRDPTFVPSDDSAAASGFGEESSSGYRSTAESNFVIQQRSCQLLDGDLRARADFEFLGILGEGGMGTVYRARQKSLERDVALKMIKQFTERDLKRLKKSGRLESAQSQRREQFVSEAVVTGALDHPNIVPIFDIATTDDGELFYAMRRVIGEPWSKAIASKTEAENIDILLRTADAIAFAHSRGVVHRDLKPENIFLGDYGEVVVMDWGLAVVTENFSREKNVAPNSGFGGSPAYMAPEMGVYPNPRITEASDIYLLGAILFEAITGRPPHAVRKGASLTEISQMVRENRIRKTDKTGELMDIAYKAMETLPEDRYSSVQEFQKAIRAYQSHTASIVVFEQAKQDLIAAKKDGDYELYQRSVYGMEEAKRLWEGNEAAKESLVDARLDYAKEAGKKQNYELGLSMLSKEEPRHSDMIRKLTVQQKQRDNRKKTVTWLGRGVVALMALMIGGGAYSYFEINKQYTAAVAATKEAVKQEGIAKTEAENARKAEKEAVAQTKIAEANFKLAEEQRLIAEANEEKAQKNFLEAEKQRKEAVKQTMIAETQRKKAVEEQKKAEAAQLVAEMERKAADEARKKTEIALADTKKAQMLEAEQRKKAVAEQKKAEAAQKLAEANEMKAKKAQKETEIALAATKKAQMLEAEQRKKAVAEQKKAEAAQKLAEANEMKAKKAQKETLVALEGQKYEAYVAEIGLVSARIERNEFDDARRLLLELKEENPDLVGWEWNRLWHLANQSEAQPVEAPVTSVTVSDSGNLLLAGLNNGKSQLLKINRKGENISFQPTEVFTNGIQTNAVAISPDETLLASASNSNSIKLWRTRSGKLAQELKGHEAAVRTLKFLPNGRTLITGSDDRTVRLWDLESNKELAKAYHYYPVHDVSLDPQGRRIATALASSDARGGRVVVWDIQSNNRLRRKGDFNEHRGPVYSVAFSPNGRTIVSAGQENSPRTGKLPGSNKDIPRGTGLILQWDVESAKTTTTADINKLVDRITKGDAKTIKPAPYQSQLLGYHADAVRSLEFSKDGNVVASSGDDFTVKLWRTDGTPMKTLRGHGGYVRDAGFLPGSSDTVISGGFDDQLRVWNSSEYAETRVLQPVEKVEKKEFEGHDDQITFSAFDRQGKRIITTSRDQTAKLWDAETGEEIVTLQEGHELVALHTEYFKNGKYVMTAGIDQTMKLWDSAAVPGREIAMVEGIGLNTYPVISNDSQWILTGANDESAKLWSVEDILSHRQKSDLAEPASVLTGHTVPVTAVAMSDDTSLLLTGDRDGVVILWDRKTGKSIGQPLRIHTDQINALQFIDNTQFASASEDRSLTLTSVETRKTVNSVSLAGPVKSVLVSPNGKQCLAVHSFAPRFGGDNQNFRLVRFDVAQLTSGQEATPTKLMESPNQIRSISFSTRRPEVMTAQGDQIRIWSTSQQNNSAKPTKAFRIPNMNAERAVFKPSAKEEVISTLAGNTVYEWNLTSGKLERTYRPNGVVSAGSFSADGKFVATASRSVRIWNVETGSEDFGKDVFKTETAHADFITSIEFSPVAGNNEIVTTSRDGSVKLWQWQPEQKTLNLVRDIVSEDAGKEPVYAAKFSTDGKNIAFTGKSGVVSIWDRQTPDKLVELKDAKAAQGTEFLTVCFSADGNKIFAGGSDAVGRVWDLATDNQQPTKRLQGHAAEILSASFITDGARILTGSEDKSIRLWDISAQGNLGREILTLGSHTAGVTSVDVVDNGNKVLTSGNDGLVKIWPAGGAN